MVFPSLENNIGTHECYSFRKKIFERHPYLENALKSNHLKLYHQKNLHEADLFIHRIDQSLVIHDLNLSSSTAEIRRFCEDMSKKCRLTVIEYGESKTCSG
ncbi:MAG: hypothetical protein QNK36_20005 [Colwellia sp.]|nr:hypothetical protein [Colwellia sp.]